MGFKVIPDKKSVVPFLSKKMGFNKGLDPMGLQNTSDATFSKLLPGLNNVTNRIRYYGFYCWLLHQYSQIHGSTDPERQRHFIRKAEYLIALSNHYNENGNTGISGSNYAGRQLREEPGFTYNLIDGITNNDSTEGTYWKYAWGIFGQYYKGSLRTLNLISEITHSQNVYMRTNKRDNAFVSGEDLAQAFDESLTIQAKTLFLQAIELGEIDNEGLRALLPSFNLTVIGKDSSEHDKLCSMLLQRDYVLQIQEEASSHRRATIQYLLQYLVNEPEHAGERNFIYSIYNDKGRQNSEYHSTLLGWYFYQFNEFWHYANTAMLNGFLQYLADTDENGWHPLLGRIREVSSRVLEHILELSAVGQKHLTLAEFLSDFQPDEYEFILNIDEKQGEERIANGFLLILSIYINNKSEIPDLKAFGVQNGVVKDGEPSTYFSSDFELKLTNTLSDFIEEFILQRIVLRHQFVAYRKMGDSDVSSQKFIIEEQYIRYLGNFEPGYTGPRINNLIAFLKDLHLINDDNTLSSLGADLKNKLVHDLA